MSEPSDYDHIRLDALREVGNIGAGHAATALAKMTGRRIMIDVPSARIVNIAEIPSLLDSREEILAAVVLRVMGDITGRTMFVLPEVDALRLSDMLLDRPVGSTDVMSVMERSSIEEAGNVVAAAYLNALSDFLGMMSMPSVPTLVVGDFARVVDSELGGANGEGGVVVCITTKFVFRDQGDRLSGYYLFLPDRPALKAILVALRLD